VVMSLQTDNRQLNGHCNRRAGHSGRPGIAPAKTHSPPGPDTSQCLGPIGPLVMLTNTSGRLIASENGHVRPSLENRICRRLCPVPRCPAAFHFFSSLSNWLTNCPGVATRVSRGWALFSVIRQMLAEPTIAPSAVALGSRPGPLTASTPGTTHGLVSVWQAGFVAEFRRCNGPNRP
jgi:hypothetical protein